jgi:hypothetical protein
MAVTRPEGNRAAIWIVIGVLLTAALIGTLWVPFYNRLTPALRGFPFFYWYQLMWVPIVAILTGIAYLLSRLAQRGSSPSETPAPTARRRQRRPGGDEVT